MAEAVALGMPLVLPDEAAALRPRWAHWALLAGELGLIGAILALTHFGRRWGWHRRWIEQRQLAERLRCLRPCAQLGDLGLRRHGAGTAPGVQAQVAQAARAIGLPDAQVDRAWCEAVRDALVALAGGQQAYFTREAATMHRLEHRLHRAGSWLFLATAVVCIGFLGLEAAIGLGLASLPEADLHHVAVWVTIATAACPALGAAIYGIRMQGDFAVSPNVRTRWRSTWPGCARRWPTRNRVSPACWRAAAG